MSCWANINQSCRNSLGKTTFLIQSDKWENMGGNGDDEVMYVKHWWVPGSYLGAGSICWMNLAAASRDLQSKGDDHRLYLVIYRPINNECKV